VTERKPTDQTTGTEPREDAPDLLERVAEAVADLFDDDDEDGTEG
jgi:hypothetical protein